VTAAAGATPILAVRDLEVTYPAAGGPVRAVRGVSFTLPPGRVLGLVGESGSGKSTTALAVMGALGTGARVTGEIRFRGEDLVGKTARALRPLWGRRLAMVFQDPAGTLNPVLTVGDQLGEVLTEHERLGRAAARARTHELLAAVQLPNPGATARRYPHQLSGGQQQRVSIALALACDPDLLVLDEPTAGLDVTTEARILDLIEALRRRTAASILYITHNLGVIGRLAHEVAVMYAGEIVEQGPVDLVFARPRHRPRWRSSTASRASTARPLPGSCRRSRGRCPIRAWPSWPASSPRAARWQTPAVTSSAPGGSRSVRRTACAASTGHASPRRGRRGRLRSFLPPRRSPVRGCSSRRSGWLTTTGRRGAAGSSDRHPRSGLSTGSRSPWRGERRWPSSGRAGRGRRRPPAASWACSSRRRGRSGSTEPRCRAG
jgi:peptide/nickel transport system ATP-binding protein